MICLAFYKRIIVIFSFLLPSISVAQNFKQIDSLVDIGRYNEALQKLGNDETSFRVNYKKGSIYNSISNYNKALFFYKKALTLKDDNRIKVKLSDLYTKQGKYIKAIKYLKNVKEADSMNLTAQYKLAKLYSITNKLKQAKRIYKYLINYDTINPEYSYRLGLVYLRLNKISPKIDSFLDAYSKDTTHIKSIEQLALSYKLLKDKDSSELFIRKGLLVSPGHVNLNRMRVNSLFLEKKYDEALKILKKLTNSNPMEFYNQKMLGRVYYYLEDYELSKKHFKNALKIDANDFRSHTYLGHIFMKQKKYELALIQYSLATFVGKDRRDNEYLGLASVFYQLKKPKKVLFHLKKAVEENSKNYEALYRLSTFSDDYYKDNNIPLKWYNKYLRLFEGKNKQYTKQVKSRIREIRKKKFMNSSK